MELYPFKLNSIVLDTSGGADPGSSRRFPSESTTPRDGSSAVPHRYGGSQSVHHHKFMAYDEDVLANHTTVTPVYTTALKKPALKAYVRSKNFCAYPN